MKTFVLAVATLLPACLVGTAQATTTVKDMREQVVSYADLDLANASDAAILQGRIRSAARELCGLIGAPMPLEVRGRMQKCADEATARAIAEVNAPQLNRRAEVVVRSAVTVRG